MLPGDWVSEVHQGFSIEKAKAETAVDHQPCSVPLPARVIGQRIELRGPDHNVLQVSPGKIWTEGGKVDKEAGQSTVNCITNNNNNNTNS